VQVAATDNKWVKLQWLSLRLRVGRASVMSVEERDP
jgi:hypothetical protein